MGKRYYCDYCDKSFADNPTSRKTHLSGVAHLRKRKAHYDSLRDEQEILQEDRNKKPCRMFMTQGECRFGERCQYSHLTDQERARLMEAARKKDAESTRSKVGTEQHKPKALLNDWLDTYEKRRKLDQSDQDGNHPEPKGDVVPSYSMAESLKAFSDLPPSLLPPTTENIVHSNFPEWG